MSIPFRSAIGLSLVVWATTLGWPSSSWAQEALEPEPQLPEVFKEAIPLYTSALGSFHRPISSKSEEAQAYFDQGFQMMYAFAKIEAVRSFRESWKKDRNCAICYWGEAWAWGSYLNGQIREEDAPHAYAAIQQALRLAPATPRRRSAPS